MANKIGAAQSSAEKEVVCSGIVEIVAADSEKQLPRFSMVAYTGGEIVQIWGKAVVDLSGVEVPAGGAGLPILYVHDLQCPVGHADKITIGNAITAEGVFSVPCPERDMIVEAGRNGFKWQASIRGPITKSEYVEEGQRADVNGASVSGPITIVRGMRLKEISVTALGADEKTSTRVAASAIVSRKEQDMHYEEWLKAKGLSTEGASAEVQAAYRKVYDAEEAAQRAQPDLFQTLEAETAEINRKRQIEAVALKYAKECPSAIETIREIAAAAAKEQKVTVQDVELQCLRATRGYPPADFHAFTNQNRMDARAIEASLAISAKLPNIEKHYPAEVLNRAADMRPRGMSIVELLLMAAEQRGVRMPSIRSNADIQTALRAGFGEVTAAGTSTFSLSGILANVQNKFLLDSFNAVENSWRAIASIKPVRDFKAVSSYRMTGDMEFEEVGPDGQLRSATASDETFTNQAKTYGKLFGITRQDLINDDLSAFPRIGARLGRGGALKLNTVFWTTFMNNSTFFTAGRGNYWADATSALSAASLKAGVLKFRQITDPDGKPKGIAPKILLVPVDLDITARELVTSITWNSGGAATTEQIPSRNVLATMGLVPVSTEYLSNSSIMGYSALAWYLLADPRDMAVMEVLFLNGQETPIVETADADFDSLGIRFRGYFDFGCAKQEYRAGLKVKGAA